MERWVHLDLHANRNVVSSAALDALQNLSHGGARHHANVTGAQQNHRLSRVREGPKQ